MLLLLLLLRDISLGKMNSAADWPKELLRASSGF